MSKNKKTITWPAVPGADRYIIYKNDYEDMRAELDALNDNEQKEPPMWLGIVCAAAIFGLVAILGVMG